MDIFSNWLEQVLEGEREEGEDFVKQDKVCYVNYRNDSWHDICHEIFVKVLPEIFHKCYDQF